MDILHEYQPRNIELVILIIDFHGNKSTLTLRCR